MRVQPRHLGAGALLFLCALHPLSGQSVEGAHAAMLRRDYHEAELEYRAMLSKSPGSSELLAGLGTALQMEGRSNEAMRYFKRALRVHFAPLTYALLAEELCKSGDLDGARPMLARILENYADPEVLAVVGPCYLALDEPIESIRVYSRLLAYKKYPEDVARIQLLRSYLRAAQGFAKQLETSPGSEVYLEAIRRARDTSSADARSAYDLASKASPYFRADLGFDQALQRWKEHPKDSSLLYQLCVLSGEEAMKQDEISEEHFADSPYFKQFRADVLANLGHTKEAVAEYQRLVIDHPDLPDLRHSLGMLYRSQQEWTEALSVFRQENDADPSDERSAARVSECLLQLGRFAELRKFLLSILETDPPPPWALLDQAAVDKAQGRKKHQLAVLQSMVRLYPENKTGHYQLQVLYMAIGDKAAAKKEKQAFLALDKNDH